MGRKKMYSDEERRQRKNECQRRYYQANKEKCNAASRKYVRRYNKKHRDRINEWQKKKYHEDPEFRQKKLASTARWIKENPEVFRYYQEKSNIKRRLNKKPELKDDWLFSADDGDNT
jgi:hypothetical protein